jgi:NAD(P)-dependent dehydrogenase (short-subunit alcohol dehydrogenase family)
MPYRACTPAVLDAATAPLSRGGHPSVLCREPGLTLRPPHPPQRNRMDAGVEECLATNHLGHFLLAHDLLPLLQRQPPPPPPAQQQEQQLEPVPTLPLSQAEALSPARIVIVSSDLHKCGLGWAGLG